MGRFYTVNFIPRKVEGSRESKAFLKVYFVNFYYRSAIMSKASNCSGNRRLPEILRRCTPQDDINLIEE